MKALRLPQTLGILLLLASALVPPNVVTVFAQTPPVADVPSLSQSRNGNVGNFELVTPLAGGGLQHFWRNNDSPGNPWLLGSQFAQGQTWGAVSLIQSNFGFIPGDPFFTGNLEVVATSGATLSAMWRDGRGPWRPPVAITTDVRGSPAFIQSRFGGRGNFELVTPLATGGLAHFWRDNDRDLTWRRGATFGTGLGMVDAVTLIQSNYGFPGNLEVVVRAGSNLWSMWRDSGPSFAWSVPALVTTGVSGNPSMVQGRFGQIGDFELATPQSGSGIAHAFRANDDPQQPWIPNSLFAADHQSSGVSLIESTYGVPGNLEVVETNAAATVISAWWTDLTVLPVTWHGPAKIN